MSNVDSSLLTPQQQLGGSAGPQAKEKPVTNKGEKLEEHKYQTPLSQSTNANTLSQQQQFLVEQFTNSSQRRMEMDESTKLLLEEKDKRITALEKQLKEQKQEIKDQKLEYEQKLEKMEDKLIKKEVLWLEQFKSIYNLSKQPNFHNELKQKLENISESLTQSKHESPCCQSPAYMQNQEYNEELYCCYCNRVTSKVMTIHLNECELFQQLVSLLIKQPKWKEEIAIFQQMQPSVHISNAPLFNPMFTDFTIGPHDAEGAVQGIRKLKADLLSVVTPRLTLAEEQDLADAVNALTVTLEHCCHICKLKFPSFVAKFQHWQTCVGLKKHDEQLRKQLQSHVTKANEKEKALIQTLLDFKGNFVKALVDFASETKQQKLEQQLMNLLGEDYNAILKLHQELNDPYFFKQVGMELVAGPIDDGDGNSVWAQYTTRKNLVKMLGKRKRTINQNKTLAKMALIEMKQSVGVALTLKEKRLIQQNKANELIKIYCKDLPVLEDCFVAAFKYLLSQTNFTKVGVMFCDGIIFPRLKSLFTKLKFIKIYLRSKKLQVQTVVNAQGDPGWCYIRLQDSQNKFTAQFLQLLCSILDDLSIKYKDKQTIILNDEEKMQDEQEEDDEDDIYIPWKDVGIDDDGDVYIRQIDNTQDLAGFFLSNDTQTHLKLLAKELNMSLTRDYRSTPTCFQFIDHNDDRFKFYNKLIHFTESEQAKKMVSSNFKSLLYPSDAFFAKLEATFACGLSRGEYSNYMHSRKELSALVVADIKDKLDKAINAVNTIQGIFYEVPFHTFIDAYWDSSQPVFIFSADMWQIIWARTAASRYAGQQALGQCKNIEEEVKNYAVTGKWTTLINSETDEVLKVMKSGKNVIKIPIHSLNQQHEPQFQFPFDKCKRAYQYQLNSELKQIELVLADGSQFHYNNNAKQEYAQNKKRDNKKKEKELKSKIRIDANEKNEGRKGRCVYIAENNECRYTFKSKEGAKADLIILYQCERHKDEILFKDKDGFYLQ